VKIQEGSLPVRNNVITIFYRGWEVGGGYVCIGGRPSRFRIFCIDVGVEAILGAGEMDAWGGT